MKWMFKALIYILVGAFCIGVTSCAGCTPRHRKKRERTESHARERREYRSERESYSERDDHDYKHAASSFSPDRISQIAEGSDYDEMIECLYSQLEEVRALKKEYFRGNLSDKEAQSQLTEIETKYKPVYESLEKASGEGDLNYNEHKKQIKLAAEYMKELNSIANNLGTDLEHIMSD